MKYSRIIYEPGKVTRIRMNRPRYMNALSHPHYVELDNAFQRASLNQECRVIILSGEGGSSAADMYVGSLERQMTRDGRTHEQLVEQLGSEEAVNNTV